MCIILTQNAWWDFITDARFVLPKTLSFLFFPRCCTGCFLFSWPFPGRTGPPPRSRSRRAIGGSVVGNYASNRSPPPFLFLQTLRCVGHLPPTTRTQWGLQAFGQNKKKRIRASWFSVGCGGFSSCLLEDSLKPSPHECKANVSLCVRASGPVLKPRFLQTFKNSFFPPCVSMCTCGRRWHHCLLCTCPLLLCVMIMYQKQQPQWWLHTSLSLFGLHCSVWLQVCG